jgi:hypothetical protein
MTKQLAIFILIVFCTVHATAQNDSVFKYVNSYHGQVIDFNVDNLGNIYLVYQDGRLKKLRSNGDSLAVFNNVRRFGKLYSIDVSNPLKVLLYYRGFGTIVILDRFLNERAVLDLRKQNLVQVRAIAQSYDNNIWIYDELESKLKKIGDDGKIIDQSNDFRLVFDSVPLPVRIIDQDKLVYLYDPAKGVYSFDYFGGFKQRVPFTGWKDFQVINNSWFGRDNGYLYRHDVGTLDVRELPLPSILKNADKVVVSGGTIYVLKDGSVVVYSYRS